MLKTDKIGRRIGITVITVVLGISGCTSDSGTNGDSPFEAERYPEMEQYLTDAFTQFCASFQDALEAQTRTDTALIPAIEWPFEVPAHRRTSPNNFVDENTSWGVVTNFDIGTSSFAAFWDLGRLVDSGVLVHDSPIIASQVISEISYGRVDGFGDDETSWEGKVKVTLSELDTETALLSASIVDANHKVKGECGDLACDEIDIVISDGTFGQIGGEFDFGTLSGTVAGTIKLTDFDVILGHDAIFVWEIDGTITNGVATVTASSGDFSATSTYYSPCSGVAPID